MPRDRLVQLIALATAGAALTGAALLQRPIESRRVQAGLVTVSADQAVAKHPKIALLQVAPGGLRAPLLNYLWIRSQQLKQDGKFFDAQGLRELICELMPHFSGVWAFAAWDMAWNISVATHTEDERWMWVSNGIKLIRDKGLYYNPNELVLYKELAWIFFSKMGQYTDEMHLVYKRQWAEEMDSVLGSPPPAGSAEQAVRAIRQIAAAPTPPEALAADPQAKAFMEKLAALGIDPGEDFLHYYGRFSGDPLAGALDPAPKTPAKGEDRIAALMSDEAMAAGRKKVLAFARRRVLVEKHRMDPDWMVELMAKYGPMDWRNVNSHAIYWATMGLHKAAGVELADIRPAVADAKTMVEAGSEIRTEQLDLEEISRLNAERTVLGAMKSLTKTGQLYIRRLVNPSKPEQTIVDLEWLPDWRFIEPTHQEYLAGGAALTRADEQTLSDEANTLRDGHVHYLEDVVVQCFFAGRHRTAQHYLNEIKTRLKPTQTLYDKDLPLRDFVMQRTRTLGTPSAELARVFWSGGLRVAYRALLAGDLNAHAWYYGYALESYHVYTREISHAKRLTPPPFYVIERDFLITLMLRPEAIGAKLSLMGRSRMYNLISDGRKRAIYPIIADPLRVQCRNEGLSFDAAFPAPPPPPERTTPRRARP